MGRTSKETPPIERGNFRLLYIGPFIAYGDRFAIAPILLSIARDLQESLAAVTAVATFYFFLYGVMQPFYGVLADRVGRVRVMRLALVGMGLANAFSAVAGSLGALIVGKAAAAGFAAAVLPLSLVYVGDKVPFDRRQHVIANVLAAGALGTVLATVGSGLLGRFLVWRAVFVVPAVLALGLALLLARLPESLEGQDGPGPRRQITRVLKRPWALFLLAIAVAEGAFMLGVLTFLPPALEAHGESAAVAGAVVAVYGVAVFLGMQVLKRFIRRTAVTPATLIVIGGMLVTAAYLTVVPGQGVANVLVASLLIGFGYCFLHSTLQTWATEVVPEARATAVTLFVTSVFTGAAIGTAAVRGLADAQRFSTLFLLAAGFTVPVVLIAAWGRSRYGQARTSASVASSA